MGAATDPGQREQRWLKDGGVDGDDRGMRFVRARCSCTDDTLVLQAITELPVEMLRAERCPDPALAARDALLAGVGHGVVQRFLDRIDSHLDQLEILPHSADKLISRVAPRQAEDGALLSANRRPLGTHRFPETAEKSSCYVKRRENSDCRQRWRDNATSSWLSMLGLIWVSCATSVRLKPRCCRSERRRRPSAINAPSKSDSGSVVVRCAFFSVIAPF